MPKDLRNRIEKFREKMKKATPGVNFTRTDAIRALIEKGLAAATDG